MIADRILQLDWYYEEYAENNVFFKRCQVYKSLYIFIMFRRIRIFVTMNF